MTLSLSPATPVCGSSSMTQLSQKQSPKEMKAKPKLLLTMCLDDPQLIDFNWTLKNAKNFVFRFLEIIKILILFPSVVRRHLEIVQNAKRLGLTISNNLTWNAHVSDVIKKASKRIYFLIQLKRANVPPEDLKLFYVTASDLSWIAVPVFHYSLPKYLINEMERVQRRAVAIILPNLDHNVALESLHMDRLNTHHVNLCRSLLPRFLTITTTVSYFQLTNQTITQDTLTSF